MKKIAFLLLLIFGAVVLMARPASAGSRGGITLPPPKPSPQPLVSAN